MTTFASQEIYGTRLSPNVIENITKKRPMKISGLLEHQKEFSQAVDEPYSAIVGGFRSGKTKSIIPRYCNLSVKRSGEVLLLIVAPNYPLLQDIDIPLFTRFLDENKIPYNHLKSRKIIEIEDVFRGQVWFRSGDSPENIIGFECTDFVIDEFDTLKYEKQKQVWEKVIARASGAEDPTGGIVTTPEGYRYTHELFVENKIGSLIRADTRNNYYLPEAYVENLYSQYDETLIDQYVKGKFVSLTGRNAYYAFSEDNLFQYPGKKFLDDTIYIGMDFNVDPMTATICHYKSGILYVCDEIFLKNSHTKKMCYEISKRYPSKRIVVAPDMTGRKRQSSAAEGITDIIILQQEGFEILGNVKDGNPPVRDRINCVNAALNTGLLYIDNSLDYVLRDLKRLKVDEQGEIILDNPEMEHMSTGLGYLVWRLFANRIYNTDVKVKQA